MCIRDRDKALADLTPLSRAVANEQIKEGKVLVNGTVKKAKYTVKEGDIIQYEVPEVEEVSYEAEDLPLDIVYEDQDVVVVNKPQGMVVHPSAGHTSGTLVNALLYHVKDLSGINGELRPGIVHRIDKDKMCIRDRCRLVFSVASWSFLFAFNKFYKGEPHVSYYPSNEQ